MKARTIVGTGKKSLLSDPGSELRLGREKRKEKVRIYYTWYRLYDLQDILDELMHFLPQLSYFVPLKNGFYSFRAQID